MSVVAPSRMRCILLVVVGVIWLLAARMLGPFDLWDQTQPRTVAYTSDIVANGRWILPIERGAFPATKPPLYNWIAAPFVSVAGFDAEWAHKAPSILALVGCVVTLMLASRRISLDPWLGATAALAFLTNYSIFKLGYLARPDMLLTMWLIGGWCLCTDIAARPDRAGLRIFLFWICVGLAGLTKGPAAAILPLYGLILLRTLHGRWGAANVLKFQWGVPLALAIVAAWLIPAIRTNPEHVRNVLWNAEILGRVTGTGPEGNRRGPIGFLTDLYYMPVYYLGRFAPWSALSILAAIDLFRRTPSAQHRRWREQSPESKPWLFGSVLFVVLTILLFSLSTGKRADYVVAAFGPGGLLAAWWLLRLPGLWGRASGVAMATITAMIMTVAVHFYSHSPCPGFADGVEEFFDDVATRVRAEPRPVITWRFGPYPIQAMVGVSVSESDDQALKQALATSDDFWAIGGLQSSPPLTLDALLVTLAPDRVVEHVAASDRLCREAGWPEQAFLYRVRRLAR